MQTACQVECAQIIEWIAISGDIGVKQGTTKMAIRWVSKAGGISVGKRWKTGGEHRIFG
jgi:hypothetical protein